MISTLTGVTRAVARVPGSCGELAQGLIDGNHFLVSCPIDMYATSSVEVTAGSGRVCAPMDSPKARQSVEQTLKHFGRSDVDVKLSLSSTLPRGKGMASSTADVSASIAATAAALGESDAMPPSVIARLSLTVEPSDGLMLPGISMFDHRNGTTARTLGVAPPMRVVVLDFGGDVDTLEFNNVDREDTLRDLQPRFEEALGMIVRGIVDGRAEDVAAGATLSAVANQHVLFKPQLDAVMRMIDKVGALGINVAHSGTVIGMLFDDDVALTENAVSHLRNSTLGVRQIYDRRIVNGGVCLVEEAVLWQL